MVKSPEYEQYIAECKAEAELYGLELRDYLLVKLLIHQREDSNAIMDLMNTLYKNL